MNLWVNEVFLAKRSFDNILVFNISFIHLISLINRLYGIHFKLSSALS